MTTTQNLHLPQWEADDRIMHDDFNDAMASIDTALKAANDAMPRIMTGTYTGTGSGGASITFPFVPKLVFILYYDGGYFGVGMPKSGQGSWITMTCPHNSNVLSRQTTYTLTDTTLTLSGDAYDGMNMPKTYYYAAFA